MKRRIVSFLGALLVLLALAPAAQACSCLRGDPRTQLDKADGAFIGRLTSVDPAPPNAGSTTYHFNVDDVFKGDIGKTVDVRSSTNGASCGFEVQRGEPMGFFLDREGSVWTGGLCGQIAPEDLRKAAAPLPAPDGSGPLAFLIGGTYGDVRTLGLDANGKTLHYGKGEGMTTHVSVCPGSHFAAEIVRADVAPYATYVVVRDLETFAGVSKSRLTEFGDPTKQTYPLLPLTVACRSPNGDDVLVFGANNEADINDGAAKIIRVRPDGHTVFWEGGKGGSAFLPTSGTKAYITTRTLKLIELDLGTRAVRDIAEVSGFRERGPAVSPDGRHVASFGSREDLYVVDVRSGDVKILKEGAIGHEAFWVSDDRLVATGGGNSGQDVIVYDASLRRIAMWSGWIGNRSVIVDGVLYGTSWESTFVNAPALTGPMKELRTFDSPQLDVIAAVPPPASAPEASPSAGPKTSSEPTTSPTATPEPTQSPAGFAAPTSQPSAPSGSSSALPAAALGVSALALGAAAFAWRRRSS